MKGITLIELLISIAIISIIAFVGTKILLAGFKMWSAGSSGIDIERNANIAMEEMVRIIKNGRKSTFVLTPSSISFLADMDRNLTAESYSFYRNGQQLIMSRNGQLKVLTENVTDLNFSSNSCITISLNLEKNNQRININTAVLPRN
ncbi:MAG: prepilin-type N-terminal cleavage/methylation domain-containing protein [Elusimicrobiota bacterium]